MQKTLLNDPALLFEQAVKFTEANIQLRRSVEDHQVRMYSIPACVLSAFASELFFKCLLTLEGQHVPQTHDLHRLFVSLNAPIRTQICDAWTNISRRAKVALDELELVAGVNIPRDLEGQLKACADGFAKLRYVYENPNDANFVLVELPEVLKPIVERALADRVVRKHSA